MVNSIVNLFYFESGVIFFMGLGIWTLIPNLWLSESYTHNSLHWVVVGFVCSRWQIAEFSEELLNKDKILWLQMPQLLLGALLPAFPVQHPD